MLACLRSAGVLCGNEYRENEKPFYKSVRVTSNSNIALAQGLRICIQMPAGSISMRIYSSTQSDHLTSQLLVPESVKKDTCIRYAEFLHIAYGFHV